MADTKISALSAASALAGTEEIPIVQSAATVKATPAQIAAYVLGGSVTVSAAGRALLDDANAAAQRTTLGLTIGTDVAPVASPTFTGIPAAPTATDGTNTTQIATTAFVAAAVIAGQDYIHLVDSKASGTDGGTSTSGSWETRTLNTEKSDTGGLCSLSSNQFTLAAGTYEIRASAPANQATYHQARLYNVTDAATILSGTSEYTQNTSDNQMTRSFIMGRFTIGASKALEIQHQVASGRATYGYGIAAGGGFTVAEEVYTVVELWKVG